MKELSTEQKAKAYDEAIERAKSKIKNDKDHVLYEDDITDIFPELKESEESEDEKIRKELLAVIDDLILPDEQKERFVAWLEKPAYKIEPKFKVGDWIICYNHDVDKIVKFDDDKVRFESGEWLYIHQLNEDCRLWTIQDAKDGDVLVCPKYAGDIIPNIFIFKNIKIKDNGVYCYCSFLKIFATEGYVASADPIDTDFCPATKEQCDFIFQKMKETGYEWDAEKKELKKIEQKQFIDIEIPYGAKDSELQEVSYYIPEGFHAEIEDNKVIIKKGEQKPAWSEKDEKMLNDILMCGEHHCYLDAGNIAFLKSLRDRVQQPKQDWSEEDEEEANYIADFIENLLKKEKLVSKKTMIMEEMVAWLRDIKYRYFSQPKQEWSEEEQQTIKDAASFILSCVNTTETKEEEERLEELADKLQDLRPQNTWKPSERQKEALLWCVVHLGGADKQTLGELLEELNQL